MDGKHIQNFASFTEKLKQQRAIQEETEKSGKQEQYAQFFKKLLQKYSVTSPQDLTDDKKKSFFDEIAKGWEEGEGLTPSGEEMMAEGRNAFLATMHTASKEGSATFEFNGKTFKIGLDIHEEVEIEAEEKEEENEGNEFSGALAKAKEAGEEEFEVDGQTYKVEEEEKKSKVEALDESLMVAGAILLGAIGLVGLRDLAKSAMVKVGANMEAEPWRLKEFVDKMVKQGKTVVSGKDASIVGKWQKHIHTMIDTGEIKTLNQLEAQMDTQMSTDIFE